MVQAAPGCEIRSPHPRLAGSPPPKCPEGMRPLTCSRAASRQPRSTHGIGGLSGYPNFHSSHANGQGNGPGGSKL